jgi:hypothetical protein
VRHRHRDRFCTCVPIRGAAPFAPPLPTTNLRRAQTRLCEGYFEFRTLGATAVKGLNAPVEVYEVVRVGPLRTHFQLSARPG